jgi:hypothetical protein
MMSSFTWWPSGAPRSSEAEASTVPSASAPAPSSAAPAPEPAVPPADRPVGRRTTVAKPVVVTKAKPRNAPAPRAGDDNKGKSKGKSKGNSKGKSKGKG